MSKEDKLFFKKKYKFEVPKKGNNCGFYIKSSYIECPYLQQLCSYSTGKHFYKCLLYHDNVGDSEPKRLKSCKADVKNAIVIKNIDIPKGKYCSAQYSGSFISCEMVEYIDGCDYVKCVLYNKQLFDDTTSRIKCNQCKEDK